MTKLEVGLIVGGTYRLERLLGRGGMGQVWLVHHNLLEEPRAIKFLLSNAEASVRRRFIEGEARLMLRLPDHPNLVRVYELGVQAELPYMVMEYVPGQTLKDWMQLQPSFNLGQISVLLDQIAGALEEAHRLGLIHRDIKPANILVNQVTSSTKNIYSGLQFKLGDFGLTRDLEELSDLTETGFTMGTPAYMAPEQAQGAAVASSDQYSLGVVLYELLTGRVPFQGNQLSILQQHVRDQPILPHYLNPALSPAVSEVVHRALAKNPSERFASVSQFAVAFREALADSESLPTQAIQVTMPVTIPPEKQATKAPSSISSSAPLPAHNLPHSLTSFVGRAIERDEIKTLSGRTRLVTLVGAGGIGKTRLAQQIALEVLDQFPDGIWLVELAPILDPALVEASVAAALNIPEEATKARLTTLKTYLKSKNLLLLLDNCEHQVAECARICAALLAECPGLHILTTSREPLNINGEVCYRVPSLKLPEPAELSENSYNLSKLAEYESIQLFCERAAIVQPSFQLNAQVGRAVAEICLRLDGIPLALELAAARTRVMPVTQIAVRLSDRFRLLVGGDRAALPRQQTLQATIDWSYELLSRMEKTLLNRLAVFAGGCSLEAAEIVCAGDELDQFEILSLLSGLVDKSLVVSNQNDEEGRFYLLETIRQYAREKLKGAGEEIAFNIRHAAWCLALAEETAPKITTSQQLEALNRLEKELDNLRAAQDWLIESLKTRDPQIVNAVQNLQISPFGFKDDPEVPIPVLTEAAFRLVTVLWKFCNVRSYVTEGAARLEAVLNLTPEDGPPAYLKLRAEALRGLGALYYYRGAYAEAKRCHEVDLKLHKEIGDVEGSSNALANLATNLFMLGEPQQAIKYYEESVELKRQLPNRQVFSDVLLNLGYFVINQGDYERGQNYLDESLSIKRQLNDKRGIAMALDNLSLIPTHKEDYATAMRYQTEALQLLNEIDVKTDMPGCLESIGQIMVLQHRFEQAIRIYATSERLRETIDMPMLSVARDDYERNLQTIQDELGKTTFDELWQLGRNTSLTEIIDYALAL